MFDRIIGYDAEKAELARFCDIISNPEYYKSYNITIPKGIILFGEPGVGKTTFANGIIEYTKRPAFVLRKNADTAQFIQNIREIFEAAKNAAPSIVVLDDMDKFGNGEQYAQEYTALQGALDDYKPYDIFVIGTVNNLYAMPASLYRSGRFDQIININNPTGIESNQITAYYLSNKNIAPDVDINIIAEMVNGCSCATLEVIVNTAALYAAYERTPMICMRHLIEAIMTMVYNLPKVDDYRTYEEKYKAAIRKAGKTVAIYCLRPSKLTFCTIREMKLGPAAIANAANSTVPKRSNEYSWLIEDRSQDFKEYLNDIIIFLSSKAAFETKFQTFDTEAMDDIKMAKDKCTEIVSDIGAMGIGKTSNYDPIFGEYFANNNEAVNKIIEQAYDYAKYLLSFRWAMVENIAKELVEKEILIRSDIYRIANGVTINTLPVFNTLIK